MKHMKKFLVFLVVASAIILMMIVLTRIAIATLEFKIEQVNASDFNFEIVEFVTPELKAICGSESTGDWRLAPRQWGDDGKVLRGRVDPDDTGQCQINKRFWLDEAIKLGYDIETFNGNRAMANWIYENYGSQPWNASKFMWDK